MIQLRNIMSKIFLQFLLVLFLLNEGPKIMATEFDRKFPLPPHILKKSNINYPTKNEDIVKNSRVYQEIQQLQTDAQQEYMEKEAQRKNKKFDTRNNDIALLRELCVSDISDISGTPVLDDAIEKLSLEKLVDLRNFTAEQGFSTSGDSCYITIDRLMDACLLKRAKEWLKKLMQEKNAFFNKKDYVQFQRLNQSVGQKIVEALWWDLTIQKELLRVAKFRANSLNHPDRRPTEKFRLSNYYIEEDKKRDFASQLIERLAHDQHLGAFLEGVRQIYINTHHVVHDEESLATVQQREREKKRKELEEEEKAKKSLWHWFSRWLFH